MAQNDNRLERITETQVRVVNLHGVDATVFANREVPIETAAVDELLGMLGLSETVERMAKVDPSGFSTAPAVEKVAITPDFHKARGIPVGTVLATRGFCVPQAIGSDINCGMRLHTTSLHADAVREKVDALEQRFRYVFFEGGRNLPMTRKQRHGLLTQGITGLLETTPTTMTDGLWRHFHDAKVDQQLSHIDQHGSLTAVRTDGLENYLGSEERAARDQVSGCIGGGNHFVELQYVEKIMDGAAAHAWGLKQGTVTVMIHTGSVAVGHIAGTYYRDLVKQLYPKTLTHPGNGIFVLPAGEAHAAANAAFWDALNNAANFAFGNRLFLSLMTWSVLREVLGELPMPLLYDAPHNLLWRDSDAPDARVIHRKGACPARGYAEMQGTPFEMFGEPVIVPGSMGASSFLLAGQGLEAALSSASHGAGRVLSRGAATDGFEAEFAAFMRDFRVVTPVDLRRPDIAQRKDIVSAKLQELKQEAPYAYKGIGPIVNTLQHAGIARVVAELRPLMTLKG
jgi:tRNA-splicing ligase RtcB (3'-phosphate/5'-hydroxy nucleic acid ligase)